MKLSPIFFLAVLAAGCSGDSGSTSDGLFAHVETLPDSLDGMQCTGISINNRHQVLLSCAGPAGFTAESTEFDLYIWSAGGGLRKLPRHPSGAEVYGTLGDNGHVYGNVAVDTLLYRAVEFDGETYRDVYPQRPFTLSRASANGEYLLGYFDDEPFDYALIYNGQVVTLAQPSDGVLAVLARDVNSKGTVVGSASVYVPDRMFQSHPAFIADRTSFGLVPGIGRTEMIESEGIRINDRGDVLATALTESSVFPDGLVLDYFSGYVWSEESGIDEIRPDPGRSIAPTDLNSNRIVAGFSYDPAIFDEPNGDAFVYSRRSGLHHLDAELSARGIAKSFVTEMNDQDEILVTEVDSSRSHILRLRSDF